MEQRFSDSVAFPVVNRKAVNQAISSLLRHAADLLAVEDKLLQVLSKIIAQLKVEVPEATFAFGPSEDQREEFFLLVFVRGENIQRVRDFFADRHRVDIDDKFFVTILIRANHP